MNSDQQHTYEHGKPYPQDEQNAALEPRRKRPVGIILLTILHFIGGGVGFVGTLFLLLFLPQADLNLAKAGASVGLPPEMFIASFLGLFVIALASGIGMWLGRGWGWYLGAFYYIFSIMRYANALVFLHTDELTATMGSKEKFIARYTGRIVMSALLYLYFFKGNVRTYFGLENKSIWKPIVSQGVICGLLFVIVSATSVFVSSDVSGPELAGLSSLFDKGQYDKVIEGTSSYLETHPDSHEGWLLSGWAYLNNGDYETAGEHFQKAAELNPDCDDAYVGLGVICFEDDRIGEAKAYYLKAIQISPLNAEAYYELSVTELDEGNVDKAILYGERAWSISQHEARVAVNLAIAYHLKEDKVKQEVYYIRAKQLGYENLDWLRNTLDQEQAED